MKKTAILTPNKTEMCGMYQLAKDLAEELDAEVYTKVDIEFLKRRIQIFEEVITLMYPMHSIGKMAKDTGRSKWICYDQGIPPVTSEYFPNFWRRQAMRYINYRNNKTKEGADVYWDITETPQRPRWTEKFKPKNHSAKAWCINNYGVVLGEDKYALYLGRETDYKNYVWLKETCEGLGIHLVHPRNQDDSVIWSLLSEATMYVTASTWEGYGRGVLEAETLGVPAVSFDTGAQKRNTKKGKCVSNHDFNALKEAIKEVWVQQGGSFICQSVNR